MDATWHSRVENERRVGNIPHGQALALRALGRLMMMGDAEPSEARIAAEAGVSLRTVQRAKQTGRGLGLLEWCRQFATADGLRQEKPCAYRPEMPAAPVVRRDRHSGGRKKEVKNKQMQRSIEQQLAACGGASTGEQLARREAHKAAVRAGLVQPLPPRVPLFPVRLKMKGVGNARGAG